MLTIGQMSRIFNISPKTLRHYDAIHLFKPIQIGGDNQYRYYKPEQFTELRQILLLRDLGVGLETIRQLKLRGALKDIQVIKRIAEEQAEKIRLDIKAQEDMLTSIHKTIEHLELTGRSIKEPQFIDVPAFTVAGMEWSSRKSTGTIPELWDRFLSRQTEIQSGNEKGISYGICITDFEEGFTYLAGVAVSDHNVPQGMKTMAIPEQTYAVFTHYGKVSEISHTMEEIHRFWLPQNGLEPSPTMDFERYDNRFLGAENENSQLDLYIPVQEEGKKEE